MLLNNIIMYRNQRNRLPEIRPNLSGSHTFSLTATAPCPRECYLQSETKIEPDLRLRQARTDFYFRVFLPSVTYSMLVCGSCGQVRFSNLESIQVRAAKIIFNLDWCTPGTLEIMYEKRLLILAHQAYYHLLPSYELSF